MTDLDTAITELGDRLPIPSVALELGLEAARALSEELASLA